MHTRSPSANSQSTIGKDISRKEVTWKKKISPLCEAEIEMLLHVGAAEEFTQSLL